MSFSFPSLAVQKDKVEQKLLNFLKKLICSENIHLTILTLPTRNLLAFLPFLFWSMSWDGGGQGK